MAGLPVPLPTLRPVSHDAIRMTRVQNDLPFPFCAELSSAISCQLVLPHRNYFFLRHQLGAPYLGLLQFFLNHRTFLRSRRPERVGKSPKELMTGQSHSHWLELLEFSCSSRPELNPGRVTYPFRSLRKKLKTALVGRMDFLCLYYPKRPVFEPSILISNWKIDT
jgi:hypothetical protein